MAFPKVQSSSTKLTGSVPLKDLRVRLKEDLVPLSLGRALAGFCVADAARLDFVRKKPGQGFDHARASRLQSDGAVRLKQLPD